MKKKQPFKSFIKSFSVLLCFVVSFSLVLHPGNIASAQKAVSVSDIYIVTEGDTLWDLSARFFGDPFLWPSLWQKNPHVNDPHWIYPGQLINLRDFPLPIAEPKPMQPLKEPLKKEVVETQPEIIEASVPPETRHAVSQDRMDSCSYIIPTQVFNQRQKAEGWGRITDSKEDKISLSHFDQIYIDMGEGRVEPGQIMTIFRADQDIKTRTGLEKPYSMVLILGKAKILEVHPDMSLAQIIKSYYGISAGDMLKPYQAMPRPILKPPQAKDLDGLLLASQDTKEYLAEYDIVFLNIGKRDGLEPGNPLEIYRFDQIQTGAKNEKKGTVILPLGEILVLKVEEGTSTGLVTKSFQPVVLGDRVRVYQN